LKYFSHKIIYLTILGTLSPTVFADDNSTNASEQSVKTESQTTRNTEDTQPNTELPQEPKTQEQSPNTNEAVVQQWSKDNAGASTPSLTQQENGGTKIEWHSGISIDNYTNDINSENTFGSTLKEGNHTLAQLQSDLRGTTQSGDVSYFQLSASATNDRSVLSQYSRQINSVQAGRAGTAYILSAGDVAPNFSSLSSALGVRGVVGQRQIGQATISGYAGVVAPSWEYIESRVPRAQLMKEVQGAKVEYAFTEKLKAYITGQHGMDKADSADIAGLSPTKINSGSIGFQYTDNKYQLAGETALSHFQQEGEQSRNGRATIIDGASRGQAVALRGGYHDLNTKYISLSQAAQPGIREAYTGVDWVPASWLSLGADLRNSKNFTLATLFSPSQMTDTDSGSLRANINFGADHPNWSMSVQESISNSRDPLDHKSYKEQSAFNLNYAQEKWNAALAFGLGKEQSEANPAMDSHTDNWQASVGRLFNNQDALSMATWSVNTNLSTSLQNQHLSSGLETKAFLSTLNISAQRNDWGMLNIMLGNGFNTRPLGQSTLRMTTVQVDGSRQFGTRGNIKLYARDVRRNMNDAALFADERVTGVQLSYAF
jgi:hypothetical protein